jgi:hypothetical protein
MKRWSRRLLLILFLAIWAVAMLFPLTTVLLATQKQIELGSARGRQLRLFLLQEPDQEGVGLEWTRPVAASVQSGDRCRQTRVVYFMWAGEGDNVTYCRCFSGGSLTVSHPGSCAEP